MLKLPISLILLFALQVAKAQSTLLQQNSWRVALERKDGRQVIFGLSKTIEQEQLVLYVQNGADQVKVTDVITAGDSLFFTMPVFESAFRVKQLPNGNIAGTLIKSTAASIQYWQLTGSPQNGIRFPVSQGMPAGDITGKWKVDITRPNGTIRNAIAIFKQEGNNLTGSFLTPSSDYRYLQGVVTGDSVKLSSFDGDNARLFEAAIHTSGTTLSGIFYSGYNGQESWTAVKDDNVALPEINDPTRLRPGQNSLNFTFNDLDGKEVSINDSAFKNKVVVVQLMGSWCANCLDETRFLANYYKQNKDKGIAIVALAYELTTDFARSKKSVEKFKNLFGVTYPMLITGVTASDDQKAEKTLPQLTSVKSFPTTLFIDKKGNIRDIHTSFYGPASGEFYTLSKNRFYETVDSLLAE